MVDKEKTYKKVLLHRTVLDSLRVYLDVSELFLQRISETDLLTSDELIVVKVSIVEKYFMCSCMWTEETMWQIVDNYNFA